MPATKVFVPEGRSYEIDVPPDVEIDDDGNVVSVWRAGTNVLLQLSSRRRVEGPQITAERRLADQLARLSKDPELSLSSRLREPIDIQGCPDVAATSGFDREGFRWIYCYAVWADLAMLITISGPEEELRTTGQWARKSLESLRGRKRG